MFITLIAFVVVPPLRDLYELVLFPQITDYLIIALVVIVWAFSVRFIWRHRLIDRYLNVDLGSASGIDKLPRS